MRQQIPDRAVLQAVDGLFRYPVGASDYFLYSPSSKSVMKVSSEFILVVDLCRIPTTYSQVKDKIREIVGPFNEDDLFSALSDALEAGYIEEVIEDSSDEYATNIEKAPDEDKIDKGDVADLDVVALLVTDRCNYNCRYCINNESDRPLVKKESLLSRAEWKEVVIEIAELGANEVALTGGEPLLRHDTVTLARFAKKEGLSTKLITNGSLISETNIDDICDAFDLVVISLDSQRPEVADYLRGEGSYENAFNAISLLNARGKECSINSVITGINVEHYEEFKHEMTEQYSSIVAYNPMLQQIRFEDSRLSVSLDQVLRFTHAHLDYLEEKYGIDRLNNETKAIINASGCGVGRKEIAIGPDGTVYPCRVLFDPSMVCGNVKKQKLANIYENSKMLNNVRSLDESRGTKCLIDHCPAIDVCKGSCFGVALIKTSELKKWASKRDCARFQHEAVLRMLRLIEEE